MRRHRGGEEKRDTELDITPMIDVVFLLLIFFIATIRMPKAEANIRVYLPKKVELQAGSGNEKEQKKEEQENVNRVVIGLKPIGDGGVAIYLNGSVVAGGFNDLHARLATLRTIAAKDKTVKTKIILEADRKVAYRHVVSALDVCGRNEFDDVSFAMPPVDKGGTP